MDKILTFQGKSEQGIFSYLIDSERSFLEKTASEYHPTIASYINSAKPIPGKMQILLTALGAGEYWGNNVNGDYFPEAALAHDGADYGHKTFESMARIYKHHINKDPNRSYGTVALSVYNPAYHRVELIVLLDMDKGRDIADRMENDDYPDWSMGCRVPFDVCVVCGNRAPTRAQYCEHAKYYLNKIWPATGQLVYVINTRPKFHDISQVLIGADRIAKTLMKVASTRKHFMIGSAYAAEKLAESHSGLLVPERLVKNSSAIKKAYVRKKAEIEKEVPTDNPPSSESDIRHLANTLAEIKSREASFPKETLDRLAQKPLPKVLTTMATLGILPKPQEFQRIVLISLGKKGLADELEADNLCFDPLDADPDDRHDQMVQMIPQNFSTSIMNILRPFMAARSFHAPYVGRRLTVMIKRASQEPPEFISANKSRKPISLGAMLAATAGLYSMFGKKQATITGNIPQLVLKHPVLAAALGVSLVNTFSTMFGENTRGRYDIGTPRSSDKGDVFERINRLQHKSLEKTGGIIPGIPPIKGLIFGSLGAHGASGYLQKRREQKPYEQEGAIRKFVADYPDAITAALAANALLSKKKGGGLKFASVQDDGFFQKAVNALIEMVPSKDASLLKEASVEDFLTSSLVIPVALGKANLPSRVVGGLLDQGILEMGSKYLSKKQTPEKGPKNVWSKTAGFDVNVWDLISYEE